jgi:hypothetical protein
MKELFYAALFGAMLVVCAGCGHNAINYGDGVGFDFGVNPESCSLSFNLRYGKILSAVVRDNAEIELTGTVDANGENGSASKGGVSSDGNVKIKIGRQINGAYVDAIEAGATYKQLDDFGKEENK